MTGLEAFWQLTIFDGAPSGNGPFIVFLVFELGVEEGFLSRMFVVAWTAETRLRTTTTVFP